MDALALLCTLHADGPTTWHRLRSAGITNLADLARVDDARLTEWMESTPAAARRFRREARHLAERVGADWLEREENHAAPALVAAPPSSSVNLPPRDRSIVEQVLARWREADRAEVEVSEPAEIEAVQLTDEAQLETGLALHAGLVEGLDAATVQALAKLGVHTVEHLQAAALDQLALASGVGYSRLDRIRRLIDRASWAASKRERISPSEACAAVEVRSNTELPRWEGAAGPFA